jgi:ATP-binding cassette, subfamily B, multidrug efflux pump
MFRYRARYLIGVVALLTATGLALAIPATVKRAVDALEHDAASAPITHDVLIILALAAGNGVARLLSRFSLLGAAQRVEYDIRNDLYAALQAYPPSFYATHRTGDLMARATSDVTAVKSLVGFGFVSLVSTIAAFAGALAAMLSVDPWLTMWALLPCPLLVAAARWVNARVHRETEAMQEQLGELSGLVHEHLTAIGVVRAYTMEGRARRHFADANGELLRRSLALARTQSRFTPQTGLIGGLGALVVLWVGGTAVAEGRLSLGALVAFNGYLAYLAWPTMALGWTLWNLRRGLTSMGRLLEITAVAPAQVQDGRPMPGPLALRFAGLTFAYDEREPALRDVSFDVEPGEKVAVVGATGSGKSTLGLLVARLWEPPPGTVFVNDRDVCTLPLGDLRTALGYVPQEGFLFSRSVLDNVMLGRDTVSPEGARAAATTAGIAEEIDRLATGWDTVVGERGLTLSGGQRQRVALARALAAGPSLLVLDDVFSNVDAAKEEEIVERVLRATGGRTVLVMTHRLRAARAADRIVVLEGGRVVEMGRHDALVQAGGAYARLWRIQQLEDAIARA